MLLNELLWAVYLCLKELAVRPMYSLFPDAVVTVHLWMKFDVWQCPWSMQLLLPPLQLHPCVVIHSLLLMILLLWLEIIEAMFGMHE